MLNSGIVSKIKQASMKLAQMYMKRVSTELEFELVRNSERESTQEDLLLQENDFQGRSSQKEETATSCNGDTKRMQVCMCGKCKKSGAVDVDVVHAGCKCMGKCKNGPNVKLYNSVDDTPAFIGIVANSLAQHNTTITNELGLNPASLHSTFFLFSAVVKFFF
ncbi:hypothetical protein Dsin_028136 [Dipteronia sinensis]|uniref:Uncharacterized protein n=1 Tax=Dipteronia sinensis TaxID=43782 RepID=A0AAE0DU49_9ROSI|nr:hypothetical protein Dsin_028136 [Dipteronia sinensis]